MIQEIDLTGRWSLSTAGPGDDRSWAARVPGCVHLDLMSAGEIDDPYDRDNEDRLHWIGETDWVYQRRFHVDAAVLKRDRVLLRCEGLDTLATITLNGRKLAATDNQYRAYEFDIKRRLKAGDNTLRIRFASAMKYVRRRAKRDRVLPAWGVGDYKLDGGGWVRKNPSNFGWDWGPMLVTCGIWRPISILAFDDARLGDIHLRQKHHGKRVTVEAHVAAETAGPHKGKLQARVALSLRGERVAQATAAVNRGKAEVSLAVDKPQRWWPRGMGDQPLYDVAVELLDEGGRVIDVRHKRIGLRTLELVREKDKWGESFHFACNGVPFFVKGANWIPADTFIPSLTENDYRDLIHSAADAHMNMLRVWGGGIYEQDWFYDLCDEMGLCVWQDFMFACGTYPGFDAEFRDNVREEARDNVRRLRHHACLALWCGNNELEQGLVDDTWTDSAMSWTDYKKLFDTLLPGVVKEFDPDTTYWPSSPHSPIGNRRNFNDPTCGDAHLWSVWHARMPYEWYRTTEHRFVSEFGFQSFPEPRTVATYTRPQDRNVTSYVMERHQRSGIGNSVIIGYMLDWFGLPTGFDNTLWLTQILQGLAIKYAVEHWRRHMPRTMGSIYWQLNDCWPVASWSSIDSLHRWKALHYAAKKFHAPLLVSGVEVPAAGAQTVDIHVSSDRLRSEGAAVRWTVTTVVGETLDSGSKALRTPKNASRKVHTLNVAGLVKAHGVRDLLIWLDLEVQGEAVSSNLVSFAKPKHMHLGDPAMRLAVADAGGGRFRVTVEAERSALWAWLELGDHDFRADDNFFHVRPGKPVEVVLTPREPMALAAVRKALSIKSLWDTLR